MGLLPIVGVNLNTLKLSEIALRQKSNDIDIDNKHSREVVQQLVEDMFETLYASHPVSGVALAALQVGVLLRVVVVDYTEEREDDDKKILRDHYSYALINPQFTYKSEETVKGRESCLSYPTLSGEVERSLTVRLHTYDQDFIKRDIEATGWLARIFQHELDHLDGILYADRIGDLNRLNPIDFPYIRRARATAESLYGKKSKKQK